MTFVRLETEQDFAPDSGNQTHSRARGDRALEGEQEGRRYNGEESAPTRETHQRGDRACDA